MERPTPLVTLEDSEPLIGAVERGTSRKLAYVLAKSEKVAISTLREVYYGDPGDPDATSLHRLVKIPSGEQNADFLTKPLVVENHEVTRLRVGVKPLPAALVEQKAEELRARSSSSSSAPRVARNA